MTNEDVALLAMQYSITLPADYDMSIIRRRIAEKGHLMDGFPGLGFKAFLHASRDDTELPSENNLYAPFYLWRQIKGMNNFLGGPGFRGLAQAFGRPSTNTWSVCKAEATADLSIAVCATREIVAIPAGASLDLAGQPEAETRGGDSHAVPLAVVRAFEPTGWTLVRFHLWSEPRPDLVREGRQLYRVGHVAQSD